MNVKTLAELHNKFVNVDFSKTSNRDLKADYFLLALELACKYLKNERSHLQTDCQIQGDKLLILAQELLEKKTRTINQKLEIGALIQGLVLFGSTKESAKKFIKTLYGYSEKHARDSFNMFKKHEITSKFCEKEQFVDMFGMIIFTSFIEIFNGAEIYCEDSRTADALEGLLSEIIQKQFPNTDPTIIGEIKKPQDRKSK